MRPRVFSARESGFTLIELLIAMALFSSLMIVIAVGFINLLHLQTGTVASRNTQQAARYAIEEMVRTARSSYKVTVPASGPADTAACFWSAPGIGVTYYRGPAPGDGKLYRRPLSTPGSNACPIAASGSGERAVVSNDSKVLKLQVSSPSTDPPIANITLSLVASSTDMSTIVSGGCDPSVAANYSCSVTELSSSVSMRGSR